ncbi:MAG TPA: hypothetical protein VGT08_00720 [Terracidiphilus sp.]|nr:hypothetical protein [Terracidiphilus sp.]
MNRISSPSPVRLLIALLAVSLAASAADAQNPAPGQTLPAASGQAAPPAQPAAKPSPENDWLARTSKLYYSSAKAGLTGFDCDVHPDWHTLFISANKGATVDEGDARLALLKTVKITMHARMKGGSTIDWLAVSSPDMPIDQHSTDMLEGMHQSVQQTLEGFLQFWSPFMDGSVVPDSAEGLEITHTATVHTIHAAQAGTELTEIFDNNRVLEQFNVVMSGTSIKFSPSYTPTAQGLLVNRFVAQILPTGAAPEHAQEMKVGIEYQTVDDLIIPGSLNMEVVGTGVFNFTFDGCTTNSKSN